MTMKLTILEALLGHKSIFCDLILAPASNKLLYLKDTEQTVVIITVSGLSLFTERQKVKY